MPRCAQLTFPSHTRRLIVRRPVEGEVHAHYGQIYVESDPDSFGPGLAEAFAGRSAGLCGAATPGALWLSTGLHTGDVGFTVEVHEQAPPLDPVWEDVVETPGSLAGHPSPSPGNAPGTRGHRPHM
jgi:hypothetical protein